MPIAAARRYAPPPSFTALGYGLLSVGSTPVDGDPHWQNGIDFQPDTCAEALPTVDGCPSGEAVTKSPIVTGIGTFGAEAVTVYSWVDCGPVGYTQTESETRASNALTRGEGRAIERVFWSGVVGSETLNPHLAANTEVEDPAGIVIQTAADVVDVAVLDVVQALGQLEGALAECYGGEGVIHIPVAALASFIACGLVVRDGPRLRTTLGTRVAAYSSGNLEGPDGTPASAGTAWAYATGAVSIRRSEIKYTSRYAEALNRSTNSLVLIAERTYVINWECCHLAQQFDLNAINPGA